MNAKEVLIITMEECGELVQACSKVMRSNGKEKYLTNLKEEIGDVYLMLELLKQHGYVSDEDINQRQQLKRKKLKKWSNLDV
jgi:NTP pyrophosphatase (non-canonical NTP hydrolase)